jgi:hypothetical protein
VVFGTILKTIGGNQHLSSAEEIVLRIFLDIAEVLLGCVAAAVVLVTILIIIGQFVREYKERVEGWDP